MEQRCDLLTALVAVGAQTREDGGADAGVPWRLELADVRLAWRPERGHYAALRLTGVADGVACVCRAPRLEVVLAWVDEHFPGALSASVWQPTRPPLPQTAHALARRRADLPRA